MRKILSFLVLALFMTMTAGAEIWKQGAQVSASDLKAGDVILLSRYDSSRPDAQWFGGYHTMKSTSSRGATSGAAADYSLGLFPAIKDRSAFKLVSGPTMNGSTSYYLQEVTTEQYLTCAVTTTEKPSIELVADINNAISFVPTVHNSYSRLIYYDADNTAYYFSPYASSDYLRFGTSAGNDWVFYYAEAADDNFMRGNQVDETEVTDGLRILMQNPVNYNRPASIGEQYLDNMPISSNAITYCANRTGSFLYFSHGYSETNVWVLEASGAEAPDAAHSAYYYIKSEASGAYLTASGNDVTTTASKSDALTFTFGPSTEIPYSYLGNGNVVNDKSVSLKDSNGSNLGSAHNYGHAIYGWGDTGIFNLYNIAAVTADAKKQEAFDRLQALIAADEANYTGTFVTDHLPGYDVASVTTYQTALAAAKAITMSNTTEEINAAYIALDGLPELKQIEDGAYYYIVSAQNKTTEQLGVKITSGATELKYGLLDQNSTDYVFQITKSGSSYHLRNLGTDMYVGIAQGWYESNAKVSESPANNSFNALIGTDGNGNKQPQAYYWQIAQENGSLGLTMTPRRFGWHANSDNGATEGNLYNFGAETDPANYNYNRWYLFKVDDATIESMITAKKAAMFETLSALITTYEAEGVSAGTDPGLCTETTMQSFVNALTAAKAVNATDSYEVQKAAYDALRTAHTALESNPIVEGYYFIVSAGNGCGYYTGSTPPATNFNYENKNALYNDGGIVKWKAFDRTDKTQVYKFTANGSNWNAFNIVDGTYINKTTDSGSGVSTSETAENAQKFALIANGSGKYTIISTNYCYSLNKSHNGSTDASGELKNWGTTAEATKFGVNVWYLHKLTDEEVENFLFNVEDAFTELEAAVEAIKTPLNAEGYKTNLQGTERGGVTSETEKAKLQAVVTAAKEVINSDTATEDEKVAAYNNAKAAFDACPTDNPIVDGHYYIYAAFDGLLLSYRTVDGADYAYKANWSDPATSLDMASVFEVKKTGENAYTVQNVKTGKYLGAYNIDHNPSDKGSFALQTEAYTTYILPWRSSHNYTESNVSYGTVTDAIDFCLFSESTLEHEYSGRWTGSGWNIHSDLGDIVAHAWRLLPVDEAYDAYMAEKDFNDLIAAADEALAVPTPANHHDNDPARNRSFLLGNEKLSVDGLATSKEAKDALQAARDAVYEGYKTDGKSLADMAEEVAALNSAIEAVNAKSNPLVDGYYHLIAEFDGGTDGIPGGFVIEADGNGIKKIAYNANEPKQMFKVEYDAANGKVYLQNVANGKYLGVVDGSAWKFSDERIALNVMTGNKHYWAKAADVTVAARSCSFILYDAAGKGIGSDNCGVKNDVTNTGTYAWLESWAFRPAAIDVTEITIGATGYSTYVSDKALIVPEGVTANGVTGLDGSDVELTQLSGNVLAADEPVILQGEAGKKFYFIATDEIGNTIAGNLLEGTGTEGKSIGANEAYVLYNNQGTAVFRIAGAMTLPAHKAYLPAGVVNGAGAKEFGLGGLTGINNAQTSNLESQTYFDLQGRKVAAPQKGQLYIVNGKKVLY